MIQLIFTVGRETTSIEIENKLVMYKDRKFPKGIKFMPMDANFNYQVIMSRNKIPKEIANLILDANTGKNLIEYQNAKDDEALVTIIKRDAALKGCVFQKKVDS